MLVLVSSASELSPSRDGEAAIGCGEGPGHRKCGLAMSHLNGRTQPGVCGGPAVKGGDGWLTLV